MPKRKPKIKPTPIIKHTGITSGATLSEVLYFGAFFDAAPPVYKREIMRRMNHNGTAAPKPTRKTK